MKNVILVVDDDKTNLTLAQKILSEEYNVAAAISGEAALKYLENHRPNMILLDILMPGKDGFEVMEAIREDEELSKIPVMFLTAARDTDIEARCFAEGAQDFITKPFVPEVLLSRVRRILELERYHNELQTMVEEQAKAIELKTKRMNEMQDQIIIRLANLIESRDSSTGEHVKNTKKYVEMIGNRLLERGEFADTLSHSYLEKLGKAAALHDIGKIQISDIILQKPERLTEEEFEIMKNHTIYGKNIIREIIGELEDEDYLQMAEDIALYHHERWDGAGYPDGLKGEQIPLSARIMAVADVFEALYSERCYKPAIRPINKVFEIIREGGGTQFDPVVADAFLSMEQQLKETLNEEA